jgi:hypothetical protein
MQGDVLSDPGRCRTIPDRTVGQRMAGQRTVGRRMAGQRTIGQRMAGQHADAACAAGQTMPTRHAGELPRHTGCVSGKGSR